ncbi:transposase [Sorangium cellulosum]|uniref:transposase n=1 Tax=Sorangium cellulosum TaxID=56 RepID=UPI001331BD26|nr:transposase [Sorangium cellulosum]
MRRRHRRRLKTTFPKSPNRSGVTPRTEHLPIDLELDLPTSWTDEPERRTKAKIPRSLQCQTEIELALGMTDRALRDGIPGDMLLADSGDGESRASRRGALARL